MKDVLKELSLAGIVPVIAVNDANDAVPLCRALSKGGLPVAEITFRTAAAEEAIKRVHEELPEVILGAGTVLNADQVDRAIAAGASYIVSPGLNPKTVKHCQERNIPIIAGCGNPSDIELAIELGLETVKFFPAEALGGLKVIKAMSAPFGQIRFMPTGGIGEKNLLEYLAFDRIVACGGSWMVPPEALAQRNWDKIEELTRSAVNLLLGLEVTHVGINNANQAEALENAKLLSRLMGAPMVEKTNSYYASPDLELFKSEGRGTRGHIALGTNSVDRAIWHLSRRGFQFDESTRRELNNKATFIYLKDEIAGFAFHLIQK